VDEYTRKWSVRVGVLNYPVAADVDGDGTAELLILGTEGHPLCVLGVEGKLRWEAEVQADSPPDGSAYPDPKKDRSGTWRRDMETRNPGLYEGKALRYNDWIYQPSLLDVNGDGRDEVIVGRRARILALDGRTGQPVKDWRIPGDYIPGGDTIGYFLTVRAGGQRHLIVPTRMNGAFCLDERLETVLWRLPLPLPAHWAFAGDVDGDGEDEVLWGYDCTGSPEHALGVVWLLDAGGSVRWRRFADEIMDDTHLDHALMLPPDDHRQGLIVLPDGPALDAAGREVFNVRTIMHHGQRVQLFCAAGGEEVLIYADRGERGGDESWVGTTGVVAVDMQGRVIWERRDLTHHSGHRIGDGWPVRGAGSGDLYAAGEVGNWGGTRHRGVGDYFVYLLTPEGRLVQTLCEYDTGYNGKGYPYTGATGMGLDLDGDGQDELYVVTNDGTWSSYHRTLEGP